MLLSRHGCRQEPWFEGEESWTNFFVQNYGRSGVFYANFLKKPLDRWKSKLTHIYMQRNFSSHIYMRFYRNSRGEIKTHAYIYAKKFFLAYIYAKNSLFGIRWVMKESDPCWLWLFLTHYLLLLLFRMEEDILEVLFCIKRILKCLSWSFHLMKVNLPNQFRVFLVLYEEKRPYKNASPAPSHHTTERLFPPNQKRDKRP